MTDLFTSVGPVVVGVDGSAQAQRGLAFATQLARRLDVDLVVVHALGLLAHLDGEHGSAEAHAAEIERRLRDEWCASLHDADGLRWRCEIMHSDPVGGLLHAADDADASLIVVGSHGAGNSDAPLLGSTSHYVVRESHRPVVVVPPA